MSIGRPADVFLQRLALRPPAGAATVPLMLPLLPLLLLTAQEPSPSPAPPSPASPRPSPSERPAREAPGKAAEKGEDKDKDKDEAPVVTRHELRVGDRILKYTVTTGMMPLKSETGALEARVFFMASGAEGPGPEAQRPS